MASAKDLPFFKIKYAFLTEWTVIQAARLFQGINPNKKPVSQFEKNAENEVLAALRDVISENPSPIKMVRMHLKPSQRAYSKRSLISWAERQGEITVDKDIIYAVKWARNELKSTKTQGKFNTAFYTCASKAIWKIYPELTKEETAHQLILLVAIVNEKYGINIQPRTIEQIEEVLRHLNSNKSVGRVAEKDRFLEKVDLNIVLDLLETE